MGGQGYEEVARPLTCGLQGERRGEVGWRVPSTTAIGRAPIEESVAESTRRAYDADREAFTSWCT
jgi:hypothetical protein